MFVFGYIFISYWSHPFAIDIELYQHYILMLYLNGIIDMDNINIKL